MSLPLFLVDAFAERPFQGNPAAVCLLQEAASEEWMQSLAMEMNQAETAFLVPLGSAYGLRWFTPLAEVALCGHATLAGAHILWEADQLKGDEPALFDTKSGRLACTKSGERISMDFPAKPAREASLPNAVIDALRTKPVWEGLNGMDALVELESEDAVQSLTPDFSKLAETDIRGVIVTARSKTAGFDFISRFFAPRVGVPEDSVTGSAHCCLAPYWAAKLGRLKMTGFQASRRGGFVGVEVCEDRVILSGAAVTTLRGQIGA